MAHPHSNLERVIDNLNIDTSSLAAVTGIVGPSKIDAAREQGFLSLMQRGIMHFQASDGSGGPLAVYLIPDSMSLAEAEEAIEADPQSSKDVDLTEQVRRKIYLLGFLQRDASGGGSEWITFSKRHRITTIEGKALQYLVYNVGGAATDAGNNVRIFCEHIGVWLRD